MSSAAPAADTGRGALLTATGQGPFRLRSGRVAPAVEELQEQIAALVDKRQRMRTAGASQASLERNRLKLARSQRQLSQALIERHLPTPPEKRRWL
jgi:hypothetical protein